MVARSILRQRLDAAAEQIEADLRAIGKEQPEVVEAAKKIRDVQGKARFDDEHKRMFHLEAIAELTSKIRQIQEGDHEEAEQKSEAPKKGRSRKSETG